MGLFDRLTSKKEDKPETQQQQQNTGTDPLSRVAGSDPSQGGIYPLPGIYPLLYIDVLKMIKTRKDEDMFIAEIEILESLVEARPAGTRMSWTGNFRFDATPGNVKSFMCELMNVDPGEVTAESMKLAVSEKNPCRGRLIRLEASLIKTKKDTDFTLCKWMRIPEEAQEKADELRKLAGFTPF